jgi:hypothetical protein
MVIPENLTTLITKVTGKYSNRVHFITPLHNQYPNEDNDIYVGDVNRTNMVYTPYKGFGKYAISKPYTNIAILPLRKNEKFKLKREYDNMNIATDIIIDSIIPHRIAKLIPYIIVNDIKCYYDNIRRTFGYDKNNVITYTDTNGSMNAIYDHMVRHNFTHYAVIYFSPKHYNQ